MQGRMATAPGSDFFGRCVGCRPRQGRVYAASRSSELGRCRAGRFAGGDPGAA